EHPFRPLAAGGDGGDREGGGVGREQGLGRDDLLQRCEALAFGPELLDDRLDDELAGRERAEIGPGDVPDPLAGRVPGPGGQATLLDLSGEGLPDSRAGASDRALVEVLKDDR